MKKHLSYATTFATIVLSSMVPFHWIVGSAFCYFSWSTMVAPVAAAHSGMLWLVLFLIPVKKLTLSALLWHTLHRLPLFVAAIAYRRTNLVTSFAIPVLCMALFVLDPIGAQAWPYGLYWFMPMLCWFAPDTVYARALTATFVAHAVGSVIWLQKGLIAAQTWLSLIPLVCVERLLMASGIILFEYLVRLFQNNFYTISRRLYVMVGCV